MIGMAEFTKVDCGPVWVDPAHVAAVESTPVGSEAASIIVLTGGRAIKVLDYPGDVVLGLDELKRQAQGNESW
jgi:hypothetical protein